MPSASRKQRINKNREKLLEYKKTLECEQCGLKDYRVIEFHHVSEKNMNVSTMLKDGYGWSRIQEEIGKCIPLCCNCHRVKHWISQGKNKPPDSEIPNSGIVNAPKGVGILQRPPRARAA